jgi:hypothetical protein
MLNLRERYYYNPPLRDNWELMELENDANEDIKRRNSSQGHLNPDADDVGMDVLQGIITQLRNHVQQRAIEASKSPGVSMTFNSYDERLGSYCEYLRGNGIIRKNVGRKK